MLNTMGWQARAPATHEPPDARAGGLVRAVLDEIDYPMLLVDARLQLLLANRAARRLLDASGAVRSEGGTIAARDQKDQAALAAAVGDAAQRGLRRWLRLRDSPAQPATLAIVPAGGDEAPGAAVLVFARASLCPALSIDSFARACALTPSETEVLHALSAGETPRAMAARRGVSLTTVRTQLCALRTKTGLADLRSMVRELARLPPMMHVVAEMRVQ